MTEDAAAALIAAAAADAEAAESAAAQVAEETEAIANAGENSPVFEEPVAESAESPAPLDDPDLPPGFEMPDLSDLDAMMKEAGL